MNINQEQNYSSNLEIEEQLLNSPSSISKESKHKLAHEDYKNMPFDNYIKNKQSK